MRHKKTPTHSLLDNYLSKFKWYRKVKGGVWYKHEFTSDAEELTFTKGSTFFTRYPAINRYSKVISFENYI